MDDLKEKILNDAQSLRDSISELIDMDEFEYDNTGPYNKIMNALCDFIGDY